MAARTRRGVSEHDAMIEGFRASISVHLASGFFPILLAMETSGRMLSDRQRPSGRNENPIDGTEKEKHYVSAVFSKVLDGPA
mmetsp:Transcript_29069/g.113039  ORF Transcript_29069/g.113039 Transcript_29069/m.113039 type:complete len:82 (+) Transcript_29069:282-527(+)